MFALRVDGGAQTHLITPLAALLVGMAEYLDRNLVDFNVKSSLRLEEARINFIEGSINDGTNSPLKGTLSSRSLSLRTLTIPLGSGAMSSQSVPPTKRRS